MDTHEPLQTRVSIGLIATGRRANRTLVVVRHYNAAVKPSPAVIQALVSSLLLMLALRSDAGILTVTSPADSGPGTLRQAILDANSTVEPDEIQFAIAQPSRLALATPLPEITQPVTIFGPGRGLVIDGRLIGNASGIVVRAPSSQLTGLTLLGFSGWGIEMHVDGVTTISSVDGCTLGLDPIALLPIPNRDGGIFVDASYYFELSNNVILGGNAGIAIVQAYGGSVHGNSIGADPATGAILGPRDVGIRLDGGAYVHFGGSGPCTVSSCPTPLAPNDITSQGDGMQIGGAQNGISYESVGWWGELSTPGIAGDGIVLRGDQNRVESVSFTGVAGRAVIVMEGNHELRHITVSPVAGIAVDLGGDGPTPNDPGDVDSGPNGLLNAPRLTSATSFGSTIVIRGTLDASPSTRVMLDFYRLGSERLAPLFYDSGFTPFLDSGIDGRAEFEFVLPSLSYGEPAASLTAVAMTGEGFSELAAPVGIEESAEVTLDGAVGLQMPSSSTSPLVSFLVTVRNQGRAPLPWGQVLQLDLQGGLIEAFSFDGVGAYCYDGLQMCVLPGIAPGSQFAVRVHARTTAPVGGELRVTASIPRLTDIDSSNDVATGTTRIEAPNRRRPLRRISTPGMPTGVAGFVSPR